MTRPVSPPMTGSGDHIERRIARVLSAGAILAVGLLLVGVALMMFQGVAPDAAAFPALDPARLVGDVVALRPEGFLWTGILVVIATPIVRVMGEVIGFAIRGERIMAVVALAILLIVSVSVAVAVILET